MKVVTEELLTVRRVYETGKMTRREACQAVLEGRAKSLGHSFQKTHRVRLLSADR